MSVLPPSALYPPSLPKCRWGWLARTSPLPTHPSRLRLAMLGGPLRPPPSALYPPSLPKCSNSLTHSLTLNNQDMGISIPTHACAKQSILGKGLFLEGVHLQLCIHHPRGLGHEYVAPPPLMVYSGVFIFTSPC